MSRRIGASGVNVLFGLVVVVWIGCSSAPSRPTPSPNDVRITVADRSTYDDAIGKRRGDVVLVDFWALWCQPCVANFPHVIELANRNWDRGLSVVSVCIDSPEATERTLSFLKEQRAGAATHLMSPYGGGSQSMEVFEIPSGALPCYKLYDRKGQLRYTFALGPAAKPYTLQDLDAAVEQLLAE